MNYLVQLKLANRRMETTVTPLATFDVRMQAVRARLEQLKSQGGAR